VSPRVRKGGAGVVGYESSESDLEGEYEGALGETVLTRWLIIGLKLRILKDSHRQYMLR